MKKTIDRYLTSLFPEEWKKYSELRYWKRKKKHEVELANSHYKFFYTAHFDLNDAFYKNKRILDIGCGPRGSLEWADMAEKRVGLDPLAKKYLKLGADRHKMEYVVGGSEMIPFPDHFFDVVCAFNSFDHVTDLQKTISEIKRVTKRGGWFLLIVEINHAPTSCEPHLIKPAVIHRFEPEFCYSNLRCYKPAENGLYGSIKQNHLFENPLNTEESAWLSVKFHKEK